MTRSSLRRLIAYAIRRGYLEAGDVVGAAAFVRGYRRGRLYR